MLSNPEKNISIYGIAGLVGPAFPLAFTPSNIQSGFARSGIWPYNPGVFTEQDFLCSYVTDRPESEENGSSSTINHDTEAVDSRPVANSTGASTSP